MIVDLGAGPNPYPDALAYDTRRLPTTQIRGDVRALPFRSGTLDGLVSRHVIEHIRPQELAATLREWRRVLRPGGMLRLTCPDLAAIARSYLDFLATANWRDLRAITYNLYGGQDYAENEHHWGYCRRTIGDALADAGFSPVEDHPPTDRHELHVLAVR